jgi:two-component system nitrogen regulation sensor histidine kinase NtrY
VVDQRADNSSGGVGGGAPRRGQGLSSPTMLERLARMRKTRRARSIGTLGLVTLGPVLALATFLVLGPLNEAVVTPSLRLVLLADLVYILVVAALVLREVARVIASRRARSAGSRLHLRLTGVFTTVALVPTILVAVFATITVNMGLEGWFSDRVSTALGQGQGRIQRGLREAFVIDGGGEIRARGERSYLFDFERPDPEALTEAETGELVIIEDRAQNEFRALFRLDAFPDRYLYVSREVDGEIISLLDETQETVQLYQPAGKRAGPRAVRIRPDLSRLRAHPDPCRDLAGPVVRRTAVTPRGPAGQRRAAGRAGRSRRAGAEEQSDDEIAMLGQLFNQMTRQLKGQRDTADGTERGRSNAPPSVRFGAVFRHRRGDGARCRGADRLHQPVRRG